MRRTLNRYHVEMVEMAIRMAPKCRLNETISNLIHNAGKVMIAILSVDSREVLPIITDFRSRVAYARIRTRYRIGGARYRQVVCATHQLEWPILVAQLERRPYFFDYLMQVGVYNNAQLDVE